jgi:hypothetical protein
LSYCFQLPNFCCFSQKSCNQSRFPFFLKIARAYSFKQAISSFELNFNKNTVFYQLCSASTRIFGKGSSVHSTCICTLYRTVMISHSYYRMDKSVEQHGLNFFRLNRFHYTECNSATPEKESFNRKINILERLYCMMHLFLLTIMDFGISKKYNPSCFFFKTNQIFHWKWH